MARASRRWASWIDIGVKAGVVEKSGSWYSYKDERIGQGRENAKTFLKQNPDRRLEIEDKIRAANGLDFTMARRATCWTVTQAPRMELMAALAGGADWPKTGNEYLCFRSAPILSDV
jgi:hypothetical protein